VKGLLHELQEVVISNMPNLLFLGLKAFFLRISDFSFLLKIELHFYLREKGGRVELLPTFKFTGKTVKNYEFTDNYR
jgi:hypothetical protein